MTPSGLSGSPPRARTLSRLLEKPDHGRDALQLLLQLAEDCDLRGRTGGDVLRARKINLTEQRAACST